MTWFVPGHDLRIVNARFLDRVIGATANRIEAQRQAKHASDPLEPHQHQTNSRRKKGRKFPRNFTRKPVLWQIECQGMTAAGNLGAAIRPEIAPLASKCIQYGQMDRCGKKFASRERFLCVCDSWRVRCTPDHFLARSVLIFGRRRLKRELLPGDRFVHRLDPHHQLAVLIEANGCRSIDSRLRRPPSSLG